MGGIPDKLEEGGAIAYHLLGMSAHRQESFPCFQHLEQEEAQTGLSVTRSHWLCCILAGKSAPGLMPRAREGSVERGQPAFQLLLTNPELEIIEGMLVDLLDAFSQGEGEVGQGTQMPPLIFALLQ